MTIKFKIVFLYPKVYTNLTTKVSELVQKKSNGSN